MRKGGGRERDRFVVPLIEALTGGFFMCPDRGQTHNLDVLDDA